jgi:hypothetical protein
MPLGVRVGNVETVDGGRQVFGSVAGVEADITALIQRTLETVGRSDTTEVPLSPKAVRVCALFWPTLA